MADIKKEHQSLKDNLKKTGRIFSDYLRTNRNKGGKTKVKDVASFERAVTAARKKLDTFEKKHNLGRFTLTGAEKRAELHKKANAFSRASRAKAKLTGRGGGGSMKMPQEYSKTALSKKTLMNKGGVAKKRKKK
jgi:hypothetical protein